MQTMSVHSRMVWEAAASLLIALLWVGGWYLVLLWLWRRRLVWKV